MEMLPNLTREEKRKVARSFVECLESLATTWSYNASNDDYINDYLENDLKRFPNQIREMMLGIGAKVE